MTNHHYVATPHADLTLNHHHRVIVKTMKDDDEDIVMTITNKNEMMMNEWMMTLIHFMRWEKKK